jgi:uncharacterized protein YjbJ (UPF0337 family)
MLDISSARDYSVGHESLRIKAEAPRFASGNGGGCAMNNDELRGKGDKIKGRAKQAVGDLTNDQNLHDEGVADEAAGNVEEGFGKTRRKVGETLDDIADKIKE